MGAVAIAKRNSMTNVRFLDKRQLPQFQLTSLDRQDQPQQRLNELPWLNYLDC